jgi:hypothetical protein
MDPEEGSSENERFARPGTSRREFLGRTIRRGALIAATTALGNELRSHHEEGAAFMASGYAKFTGKLGVCISTAGPGAVHLLNGLWFCLCAARGSGSCTGGSLADHRSAGVSRGNDRQRGRCISAGCLLRFNERRMNRIALVS